MRRDLALLVVSSPDSFYCRKRDSMVIVRALVMAQATCIVERTLWMPIMRSGRVPMVVD